MAKMGISSSTGLDERKQHPGLRKRERAFEFQTDPACGECTSGGRLAVGQTMESSSAVRVIEVKSPLVAHQE